LTFAPFEDHLKQALATEETGNSAGAVRPAVSGAAR
jgi:hypothetical protein